jgi:hypothetical protein
MTRLDWLVVMVALLVLPALYSSFWGNGNRGEFARIQVGKQTPQLVSLQDNRNYRFKGPLGTSVIEVHDGRIRFIESPCTGKQCIHSGWLGNDGEFAACLPNLISITVSDRNPRFDSINF